MSPGTAVTARVVCSNKGEDTSYGTAVTFSADYADGRNAAWAAATPALSLTMTLMGEVADNFTPGGRYTLTFTETDD